MVDSERVPAWSVPPVEPARAAEYRRRGWWSDETVADHVARNAARHPDAPAFTTCDGVLSWSEYESSADALAVVLLESGLAFGDRVAIRLPDGPSYHVAQLACEKAGVVAVGLAARAGAREVNHLLAKTGAVAVISHVEHRGERMADVVRAAPGAPRHVLVPRYEADRDTIPSVDGIPRAPASGPDALRSVRRIGADDLWLINSTSGTTGLPKCVLHHQNRWHYFSRMAIACAELGAGEVIMSVVPTPYGFGQWTAHFTPCYIDAHTLLAERFEAAAALALLERERATVLCAVSTQLRMLLADPAWARADLSSLRVIFTGGEPVPYDAARRVEERTGAPILNVYGSNEAGFVTGTTVDDPRERRLRTAGRVPPGTELRLYGADGRRTDARRGQPGSRGPSIGWGYLDDPGANRVLFTDDGFVLGADTVQVDDEGYVTVVGRTSDLIIRGGKNISAPEVEAEVSAHPAVALAAAVPLPDPLFGERVCVFAELRAGAQLALAELSEFLLERGVSKELLPERLVVVDALPQSAGGKVAKRDLRARAVRMAAAEAAGAADAAGAESGQGR